MQSVHEEEKQVTNRDMHMERTSHHCTFVIYLVSTTTVRSTKQKNAQCFLLGYNGAMKVGL
jgi:hypothetical protein